MLFHFVIPDPATFPSGGNLYNAQLIEALSRRAVAVKMLSFEAFQKVQAGKNDLFVVDTLYLEDLRKTPEIFKKSDQIWLLIHHLESLYPPEGTSENWFKNYEEALLRKFDGFITSSPFTADYLKKNGLGSWPCVIVEPALDRIFEAAKLEKSDSMQFIMAANLIQRKGVLPFLESLQSLLKGELPAFELTIIGTDKLEPAYAEQCKETISEMSFVRFLSCTRDELFEHFSQSHLLVSAAYMETFGMALQEARASGLPILAFDGGNAGFHVEEGITGWTFDRIGDLAAKLIALSKGAVAMEKLLSNAKENIPEKYDWNDAADRFIRQMDRHFNGT